MPEHAQATRRQTAAAQQRHGMESNGGYRALISIAENRQVIRKSFDEKALALLLD
jgi:hypothetical protein